MFTCNEKHSTPLHCCRVGRADFAEVCPHIVAYGSALPPCKTQQQAAYFCIGKEERYDWYFYHLSLLGLDVEQHLLFFFVCFFFSIFTRNTENNLSVLLLTENVCSDKQH